MMVSAFPLTAKPLVVTTFSILKDWVQILAEDNVDIVSLVGPNQDAHTFEPKPDALKTLFKADLIITYGFNFESWFERLKPSLPSIKKIVYATHDLEPLNEYDALVGREMMDPHGWHDLSYAIHNCKVIAKALIELLPHKEPLIIKNRDQYIKSLIELDQEIRTQIKDLKEEQKIIVTSHDGFSYFAKLYGIKIFSLQGLSTESQPSAKTIAHLIETIKSTGVKTIFLENITNPALMRQIAQETHTSLKGPLYSDALSETHQEASTFLKLMRHNVGLFIESMKDITPK
jgi:zinc/manganese transport system substrate-binding protein